MRGSEPGRVYRPAVWLYIAGIMLLLSGLFHLGVWAVLGGMWEGAVSWRKPILFGLSAGITALSLGWVMNSVRPARRDWFVAPAAALCLIAEVGFITVQQWRGVASHFNRDTPLDAVVTATIGWLIVAVTLFVLDLTRRSWGPLSVQPDLALAIRAGMILLTVACGLGFWAAWEGERQLTAGNSPEVLGAAGVLKFPHGMPMHALQWFPLTAWMLARCGVAQAQRVRSVGWTIAGVVLLTAYSLWQTLAGRGRFDWTAGSGVLLLIGACCLAAAWLPVLVETARRLIPTTLHAVQRDVR